MRMRPDCKTGEIREILVQIIEFRKSASKEYI